MRRAAAVFVLLVATAVLAPGASSTRATAACSSAGLVVWLNTEGNGAAGSFYYHLELTNLSGHACKLFGYPGVSAIDLGGRQIGRAAGRDAVHPARTVTLARGATANAILRITDVANFPASTCRMVTAAGLRVYPPGQTGAKIIPFPFQACSHSGPVYLNVETVQPGN